MRTDFYFASCGKGQIHCCCWMPDTQPKAVLQIVHGIAEYIERYDEFARYLNGFGIAVVAEDHMGHGQSINNGGVQGYFHGGWFAAVQDSYTLLEKTRGELPGIPYILFGHSMGSFMARTMLAKYPDSGISAAVICGTGWQPRAMMPAVIGICEVICKKVGEENPSEALQNLVFGSYNKRVEHPRTPFDWLSRDAKSVDAYIAHPLCGFTASCGLLRDMLKGIRYVEQKENLNSMDKKLPVLFIAGGDDPVGSYGSGVETAAAEFKKAGMEDVTLRIFPLARHEILNEINRAEIFQTVSDWLKKKVPELQ